MSRRKKSKEESRRPHTQTADASAAGEHDVPDSSTLSAQRPSPAWLIAVITLAIAWWALLGGLAVRTANPVTLNRDQILVGSDTVVTGRIVDLQEGTVRVEKRWTPGGKLQTITVENLDETGARRDHSYILPLTTVAGKLYQVTPTRLPNEARLVYPATDDAVRQLTDLLKPAVAD